MNPPAHRPAGSDAAAAGSKMFRPLKWNEFVRPGDFTAVEPGGFELWEGPNGFRADAYFKTIYRKLVGQRTRAGQGSGT